MMSHIKHVIALVLVTIGAAATTPRWAAHLVITAQDGKWASVDGDYEAAAPVVPDTLVVLDTTSFPLRIVGQVDVEHSVIAPPMAIALSPSEKLALVAAPKRLDPANKTRADMNGR
jgi:hypothetical protein